MVFYTANGLNNWKDGKPQTSMASAADMVRLGERLLEYPFLIEMTKKRSAVVTIGGKQLTLYSTNILINTSPKQLRGLKPVPGVDGMKTGYIEVAGACLTFSVERNGRRMIGCVTKLPNHWNRYMFCRRLIDWAYDSASLERRPARRAVPVNKQPPRRSSGAAAGKPAKPARTKSSKGK